MEASAVPDVFQPMVLRSGFRYRSLRRHHFTSEEKAWICEYHHFCDRYDIPFWLISQWIRDALLRASIQANDLEASLRALMQASDALWGTNTDSE